MRPQTGSSTRELRGVGETEPLAVPARLSPPLRFADTVISNSSWKILGLGVTLCHWRANGDTRVNRHTAILLYSPMRSPQAAGRSGRGAPTRGKANSVAVPRPDREPAVLEGGQEKGHTGSRKRTEACASARRTDGHRSPSGPEWPQGRPHKPPFKGVLCATGFGEKGQWEDTTCSLTCRGG